MEQKIIVRIFAGAQVVQKKMTTVELEKIKDDLQSKKDEWLSLQDNEGRQHFIRFDAITGVEETKPVQPKKKKYITIKALADFFGVQPITVTRNVTSLEDLATPESKRPNRRATLQAALELRKHLLASEYHKLEVPDESAVRDLFPYERTRPDRPLLKTKKAKKLTKKYA